jgi:hypothetical protein
VAGERIRPGEVNDVQVAMRHPSRTGLAWRDGRVVQVTEPLHLLELRARCGAAPVSRFRTTAALGDGPLITFRLRADRGGPLEVMLRNTPGRFRALVEGPVS